MEERQVTVDGVTYPMPRPFLILATQNPIEYEGTFPLPEAQVDRFMLRITLGYPARHDEIKMLDMQKLGHPIHDLEQVITAEELLAVQESVKQVYVDDLIKEYIVAVCAATREHAEIYLGASPRGSLSLYQCGRALSAIQGRENVIPDDIKTLAESILAHRLIISPSARIKSVDPRALVQETLSSVPVPGARGSTSRLRRS